MRTNIGEQLDDVTLWSCRAPDGTRFDCRARWLTAGRVELAWYVERAPLILTVDGHHATRAHGAARAMLALAERVRGDLLGKGFSEADDEGVASTR